MNCPSCGAPMRLKPGSDAFKCDYCQSVYLPGKDDDGVRVLGEPSGQACPLCSVPLVEAALAKVRILYCAACRGMLVPMQVFEGLVDELRATQGGKTVQTAPDSDDLRRRIDCPQCHHRMDTHLYGGPGNVVIDSCEECSFIWLDRGELMHIVHAPDDRIPEGAELA
ncbi:MAG: zf-TFIIB domain-containing protein [Terracidiphilus sp.]